MAFKRRCPPVRRSKHLCADARYRSADNLRVIDEHGYITLVVDRRNEIDKRRDPTRKAMRWVVEASHFWFNPGAFDAGDRAAREGHRLLRS